MGASSLGLAAVRTWLCLGSASISVSSVSVDVTLLQAVVVTGMAWSALPPSEVPWLPNNSSFTASVAVSQTLSAEGQTGAVLAYASFSDGQRREQPFVGGGNLQ